MRIECVDFPYLSLIYKCSCSFYIDHLLRFFILQRMKMAAGDWIQVYNRTFLAMATKYYMEL